MLDAGIDRARAQRAFNRAARTYESAAVVQRAVREDLLQRLELLRIEPTQVLDAGSASGASTRALKTRYRRAQVIGIDFALGMLREAKREQRIFRRCGFVCADAQRLPLRDASIDLIFSVLMPGWCDLPAVLGEFRRVLRARGGLAMATLGPDTLCELRAAWAQVDALHAHVQFFQDMHEVGDALVGAGFASPVLDVDRFTVKYQDARAVMSDLKSTGMRDASLGRRRTLTGPRRFASMCNDYATRATDGAVPATMEIVFASAWVPDGPRETSISLDSVRAQLPGRTRATPGS